MRRVKLRHVALALVAVALAAPTAATTKASANEGVLNMIAWEGYLDAKWVKPFTAQTGCKVNAKYAGSSDEMVTLMRSGGGGQVTVVRQNEAEPHAVAEGQSVTVAWRPEDTFAIQAGERSKE